MAAAVEAADSQLVIAAAENLRVLGGRFGGTDPAARMMSIINQKTIDLMLINPAQRALLSIGDLVDRVMEKGKVGYERKDVIPPKPLADQANPFERTAAEWLDVQWPLLFGQRWSCVVLLGAYLTHDCPQEIEMLRKVADPLVQAEVRMADSQVALVDAYEQVAARVGALAQTELNVEFKAVDNEGLRLAIEAFDAHWWNVMEMTRAAASAPIAQRQQVAQIIAHTGMDEDADDPAIEK